MAAGTASQSHKLPVAPSCGWGWKAQSGRNSENPLAVIPAQAGMAATGSGRRGLIDCE